MVNLNNNRNILDHIFNESSVPAFLVGSGISIDPPSSLPSGDQFTKYILEKFLPSNQVKGISDYIEEEQFYGKIEQSFLRFEQLMSIIQEDIDPNLSILDIYADCNQPNFNHFFLANAILRGSPVLTTNFDSLIEHALLLLGANRKEIISVIEKEEWEKFGKYGLEGDNLEGPPYPVYKLHGSIRDEINDRDTHSSIQATLEQIAAEKSSAALTLEPWKFNILKACMKFRHLVVIGYSGLDDFDIIPSLKRMEIYRQIVWISHSHNYDLNNALIKSKVGRDEIPFDTSNRLERLLYDIASLKGDLHLIKINTRLLLEYLQKHLLIGKLFQQSEFSTNPKSSKLNINHLTINDGIKWRLAGRIWKCLGQLNESLEALKIALTFFDKIGNIEGKSRQLTQLGIVSNELGESDNSLIFHKQALTIDKRLNIPHWVAADYNNLGKVLYGNKNYQKALIYFNKGLKIAKKIKDLRTTSAMLINIGNILSHLKKRNKAMEYYEQALSFINEMGDFYSKFSLLTNIGSLCVEKGDYDKAVVHYKEAKKIAKRLGDKKSRSLIHDALRDIRDKYKVYEDIGRDDRLRFALDSIRSFEPYPPTKEIAFLKIHNKDPIFSNKKDN